MKFLHNTKIKLALILLKHANEEEKRAVLSEAVKHLFNAITSEDILKILPDGSVEFEGKTLAPSQLKDLKTQAKLLNSLMIWKILKKDVQYQVNKKLYMESRCELDIVWGQLLTFLWDVISTRINQLNR